MIFFYMTHYITSGGSRVKLIMKCNTNYYSFPT